MPSTTFQDTSRVDPAAKLIGKKIDKYQVVRMIGRGGMGRVYEALNTTIQKRVAMKLIDQELAKNAEATARFQREALAASAVESPYIVQIFDAGATKEGVPYIVMELLRGRDLGSVISEHGRIDVTDTLLVTAQILKGLHHAHAAGIIHRDLKPDNVFLVDRDDEPATVKLLDFGVSKIKGGSDVPLETLTRQGTVVGTPFYMSPEQAQAFPDVDSRADIYSVGAILFECLSGRPPHRGKNYEQVIVSICMKDVDDVREHNADVPEGVAAIVSKALSRDRDMRYPDARAMLEALMVQAPELLRTSTPSGHLRISSKPGSVKVKTPRVISTPSAVAPGGELADTMHADSADNHPLAEATTSLQESGITRTGSTQPSLDTDEADDYQPPTLASKRRWPIALAPGVALMLALVLWFQFSGSSEPDATAADAQGAAAEPKVAEVAEAEADEDAEPAAEPAATAVAAAAEASASASATPKLAATAPRRVLAAPRATRPRKQPAKPAPPKSNLVDPPKPKPKPGGLEILTR